MREHRFDAEDAALRPKVVADRGARSPTRWGGRPPRDAPTSSARPAVMGLQRAVGNGGGRVDGRGGALAGARRGQLGRRAAARARRHAPTWRAGSGTTSATYACTTTARPTESAQSVNAHAYTVGSNVVFQRDKYDPGSDAGRTMLAHELTHVVQQRSGPVDGTPTGGGIKVSDPSDRFEREAAANAERVMSAPAPASPHRRCPGRSGRPAGRRGGGSRRCSAEAEEEEEETAQGTFVQREGEEEEEETAQGTFVQREEAEEEEETAEG